MKIFFVFLLSLFLLSCKQTDKNLLSQDVMEKILWDITQADVFTQDFISKDSSKNLTVENLKLQQKIFAKYKTDKKIFYRSYEYYLKHEELLKPLLDSIIIKNGRIRENLRLKKIIKADDEQVK